MRLGKYQRVIDKGEGLRHSNHDNSVKGASVLL